MKRELWKDKEIKQVVQQYVESVSDEMKDVVCRQYFTEAGVKNFLKTGRISELPESVYEHLEYQDRQVLVRRLIKATEQGNYCMIKEEAPIAHSEICIYSVVADGYLLIPNEKGDRIFVQLRESALLNTFQDYLEHIDEKYIYSAEEATAILRVLLAKKSA